MTHTRGPWRLASNDPTIVVTEALDEEGNCSVVADVIMVECSPLIAASPLLLDALVELTALMDDIVEGNYKPDSFTTQPARAAITAATGGE